MVFFFGKKPKSSQAVYDEILNIFKRCDVNMDGKLSWEEVKAGFRELQSRWPAYNAQRAFRMADKNGDGFISEAELDDLVQYVMECYKGKRQKSLIIWKKSTASTAIREVF